MFVGLVGSVWGVEPWVILIVRNLIPRTPGIRVLSSRKPSTLSPKPGYSGYSEYLGCPVVPLFTFWGV